VASERVGEEKKVEEIGYQFKEKSTNVAENYYS
jgi:hypothetical protein